jgi:hypothetical protein
MSEPLAPPPLQPLQDSKPKKTSGCLKALLIVVGAVVICMIIVGTMVYRAVSWLTHAPQPTPAIYEPLKLSEGEQEDVNRILVSLDQAKKKDSIVEETSITPEVFNGVIEKILEGERLKHPEKKDIPLALRGGFTGNQMHLKFTAPITDEQAKAQNLPTGTPLYVNAEAVFNIEIVEGEIKQLTVDRVAIGGKDAPFLWRLFTNQLIEMTRQENQKLKKSPDNPLAAIKLLKREGDRLHLIIDGKKLREQESRKNQDSTVPDPKPVPEVEKKSSTTF